jgi:hypothetical protein
MFDFGKFLSRGALALFVAALLLGGPAAADSGKVLVELFTSQGCSSCPPADRFLGELAERDDVIALSYHVDYWNYLGWRDPFSSAASTTRQRDYRKVLGLRYVYTPQMVIGGIDQAVGSGRGKVLSAIERRRGKAGLNIAISHPAPGEALVTISAGAQPRRPAAILLFAYDRRHATEIRRGENEGVTLVNRNVVRTHRRIGTWNGEQTSIRLSLKKLGITGQDGCAIIVQPEQGGAVYGATAFAISG